MRGQLAWRGETLAKPNPAASRSLHRRLRQGKGKKKERQRMTEVKRSVEREREREREKRMRAMRDGGWKMEMRPINPKKRRSDERLHYRSEESGIRYSLRFASDPPTRRIISGLLFASLSGLALSPERGRFLTGRGWEKATDTDRFFLNFPKGNRIAC
ncbi:hypothetical protein CIRG_09010 [Coccidioides immitis RMSCC 2394]|uniref:Uncharacterized protein n=1 Tax=Coccidioides immitis RMSCC 2394 TaxID=404692 RepID=A0A0J7BHI1_COCIT|nr:hypothetical protein CIRG_09010 [Coccidioides immitis RMSCC 2394]